MKNEFLYALIIIFKIIAKIALSVIIAFVLTKVICWFFVWTFSWPYCLRIIFGISGLVMIIGATIKPPKN